MEEDVTRKNMLLILIDKNDVLAIPVSISYHPGMTIMQRRFVMYNNMFMIKHDDENRISNRQYNQTI